MQIVKIISIHLMLMLIQLNFLIVVARTHFNTSHVNVNQDKTCFQRSFIHISIHLMLMLIIFRMNLTKLTMLHFNTSHVNVNLYLSVAKKS